MRSKVRAYSHQGHGPRADQQAGYISASPIPPPHLRRAAGPYIRGKTGAHGRSAKLPLSAETGRFSRRVVETVRAAFGSLGLTEPSTVVAISSEAMASMMAV